METRFHPQHPGSRGNELHRQSHQGRSKTYVPDRSFLQAGGRRKAQNGIGKYARRPRDWVLDDLRLVCVIWFWGCKPETSVVEQRSYEPSCRHAICKASAPEDAVQRSGQRSTVMVGILIGTIGSVAEVRHADRW